LLGLLARVAKTQLADANWQQLQQLTHIHNRSPQAMKQGKQGKHWVSGYPDSNQLHISKKQ
jgi:hypothetical protein